MPAGRGFPLTYLVEGHSWAREDDLGNEIPVYFQIDNFQPIDFVGNLIVYFLVFSLFHFAYSKLFKGAKKK